MNKFLVILIVFFLVQSVIGQKADSSIIDSTSAKFVENFIEQAWNKDFETALSIFNKAISLNDTIAEVYWRRGSLYLKNGDNEKALLDFTKSIELDSLFNNGYAYWNRAITKEYMGDNEGALVDYNQAVLIGEDQQNFVCFRGILKYKMGYYEGALIDLNKAIELWDDYHLARRWRAPLRTQNADYIGAMDDYKKIHFTERDKQNPNFAYDFYLRGLAKFNTNDTIGACEDWKIAEKNYKEASEMIELNCQQ